MLLEELKVYEMAMDIAERVWHIVSKWDFFAQNTVGRQLVRAVDSIAANLSEGFGRYHYKENRNFGYYSRGSLFESRTWLSKARHRNLISVDDYEHLFDSLECLGKMLNAYIKSIGPKDANLKEDSPPYEAAWSND